MVSGLLLDALIIRVVDQGDDREDGVAGLVIARRLILIIPCSGNPRSVRIPHDLLISVGVENVSRPAGGRLAVDDLVSRVVRRCGADPVLVLHETVAAGVESERVAVRARPRAVFARELISLVIQPRHTAGVGLEDTGPVPG